MKKRKTNITLKFVSFTVAVISALLVFFYVFQLVRLEKKLLRNNLFDKAKTISYLYSKTLAKAIETRDDLTLISHIENIMKIDDIKTAYVLDNSGKVILHDKTSQWGKIFTDDVSKNAVKNKRILYQKSFEQKMYLFSSPLTSSSTLCIGLSDEKMNEILLLHYKDILYTSLIVLFSCVLLFAGFVYFRISVKLRKIERFLHSISLSGEGRIPVKENDDFWELSELINEVIGKVEAKNIVFSDKVDELDSKALGLLQELCGQFAGGIMILDSDYRIISANDKAQEMFQFDGKEISGRHILDVVKIPEFIELLKESSNNPGKTFEKKKDNLKVKIRTIVNRQNELAGSILMFE